MFGSFACLLYSSLDVLCCTASILNICAISLDRWLAISRYWQRNAVSAHMNDLHLHFEN